MDYSSRLPQIREEHTGVEGYLDNAASPICAKSIVAQAAAACMETPLVNPHSHGPLARQTSHRLEKVRNQVLELLNADPLEYAVVFTLNATAAVKLVGECLSEQKYAYLRDSHTSIIGLRNLSRSFAVLDAITPGDARGEVVSFPLQSNFHGRRYPLEWIKVINESGGISLVDMAAYCASAIPDFGAIAPDLSVLSFYKMFGFPDLGALIVRRSDKVASLLAKRRYFGGGTVAAVTAGRDFVVRKSDIAESLQDGTAPFHTIVMLGAVIDAFKTLYGSFKAVELHTQTLRHYCMRQLEATGLCEIISPAQGGPIVTFTLKNGGYHDFDVVAGGLGIQVRTGTLCNIGAFTQTSTWTDEEIAENHQVRGKSCNDETDMIGGRHTGVIRASFGPYTSREDIDRLVGCVRTFFSEANFQEGENADEGVIKELVVYPVKSCAGVLLQKSLITQAGLQWDREFCLVDLATGAILRLKKYPIMAVLQPQIHLESQQLSLSINGEEIWLSLEYGKWRQDLALNKRVVVNIDAEIITFLSKHIGVPCTIAKCLEDRHGKETAALTLANSSPLLFISQPSAAALSIDHRVFRANIILSTPPFAEDGWRGVRIGNAEYDFHMPCRRCNMICVTPEGNSDAGPYLKLSRSRKFDGKLYFGQLGGLATKEPPQQVALGDRVYPLLPS